MAMEKNVQRNTAIELEQEDAVKEIANEADKEETPTITTSTITEITRKRSRNTDKDQHPNNNEGKQEPNNHGAKPEPKKSRVALYGNYNRYYGYRVLKESDVDPRLKYFKKEWFEGKDCLDVGCNTGDLTITIAKNFACKSMVGVDIDTGLVHRAYKCLEKIANNMETNSKSDLGVNCLNGDTSCKSSNDLNSNTSDIGLSGKELLRRVSFKTENFVRHMEAKPTYDTVLCLSVTKWVHLNWGDDGLIRLFAKIRNLLRPGGVLVLEPQPWKSYKNKHLVSEVVQQNFHEIVLRPNQFKEVLLDRVGFRSMQSITGEIEENAGGFTRPIYLVRC